MDYKALGKRVRQQRQVAGLTQEEVAEMAGVSCSFIGHIERGEKKASIETLICLCNALKVSPTILLQESLDQEIVNAASGGTLIDDLMQVIREHNLNMNR
ncbi:MAG: helix-turn-helix transcriptional regulator [Clostridia bacterium]|nr:helix-turn-helix transcriptional regulator [Clostridia bacterium]